jgi:NADH-quinone oxidoreductase subunit J
MLETGENGYALPFEVVSILLLAAMVGCIVIAIKAPGPIPTFPKGEGHQYTGPANIKTLNEKDIID